VISIGAYGYEGIAKHPEQIFTSVGMAEEFVAPSGGRVAILAPSGSNACAEIRLTRAPQAAPWLADV
jgi:hypothetical protein